MLERFKPRKEDVVRIPHQALHETVSSIFEKMGVSSEGAAEGADVLVMTDLRGVESHGVSNMMRVYVQQYIDGEINPRPNVEMVRESPGTAVVNADRGLGIILGREAMNIAIDKAKKVGMGVVTMYDSGHIGAVGHFAMIAAQCDMVGVCITAGGNNILPTFGAEGRLGANPISIAAPAKDEVPFLFDVATSTIALNKTALARRVGSKLLPAWVADRKGNPIMEEALAPETHELFGLPIGGTREQGSHKGYGFSMMVEILGAMLSGSVPSMLDRTPHQSMYKNYFAAYNIAAFTDVNSFKDNMDQMLKTLRETKPAPGHERVIYPGLPEYEDEQERRANGIPLHKEVVQWFDDITNEIGATPLRRV